MYVCVISTITYSSCGMMDPKSESLRETMGLFVEKEGLNFNITLRFSSDVGNYLFD